MSEPPPILEPLSALSFNYPIPKSVRDYGRALDPRILEPGDLLLIAQKTQRWPASRIVAEQERLFAAHHSRWHHAAVSGGKFEICEATRAGVKAREYWEYMTDEYEIKIRRLKNVSKEERNLVAYYAATHVGTPYGFGNLWGLRKSLAQGDPWDKGGILFPGVVCSQLYYEACMRIGILLNDIPSTKVCPAHLSLSPKMFDVDLHWVRV